MEKCSKCNHNPIINQKYKLCDNCNYVRLHGETKQTVYSRNSSKNQLKKQKVTNVPQLKRTPLRTKVSPNADKLKQLKDSITQKAIDNGTYYCSGCGISDGHLDRSHILSVGQRKDLELVEENIDLLCRSCHEKWESGDVNKQIELNCFKKYVDFIYEHDSSKFWKMMGKMTKEIADRIFSHAEQNRFNRNLPEIPNWEESLNSRLKPVTENKMLVTFGGTGAPITEIPGFKQLGPMIDKELIENSFAKWSKQVKTFEMIQRRNAAGKTEFIFNEEIVKGMADIPKIELIPVSPEVYEQHRLEVMMNLHLPKYSFEPKSNSTENLKPFYPTGIFNFKQMPKSDDEIQTS